MKSVLNIINNFFYSRKKLDLKALPSQGFFYNDDFSIWIKKASQDEINEYKRDFIADDLVVIISKIKKIVSDNIILNEKYIFEDIKSVDIVYLFLEIVKYSKNKKIIITYADEEKNRECQIEFDSKTFNYFKPDPEILSNWNSKEKNFQVMGYAYTLPSIGVENCVTFFLVYHSNTSNSRFLASMFYDFTFFVGHKSFLTFNEIENLIQVFNSDIEPEEMEKIKKILDMFTPFQKYSLIKEDKQIDINSKIDLENIWD